MAWRLKAANTIVMVLVAVPALLLAVLRQDVPFTLFSRIVVLVVLALGIGAAAVRSVDYRVRVWVLLVLLYLLGALGHIVLGGPFGRAAR